MKMQQFDLFDTTDQQDQQLDAEQLQAIEDVLEQRRDAIEEKRDAREERYSNRIQKNRQASAARHQTANQIGERFAFGQPILVGHHSEKRARRDRDRMWDNTRKAIDHDEKAKYWAERLAAMENNTAISSDDPDALAKLEAKLQDLTEAQELMKRLNRLVRKIVKLDIPDEEKAQQLSEQGEISLKSAKVLLTPDSCNRIGFPDYKTKNNNANMRRVRQRIEGIKAQLETIAEEGEESSTRYDDLGLTVVHNHVLNRIQLVFDGKPSKPIREHLKKVLSFRWAPSEEAWQRQLNSNGIWAAEQAVAWLQQQ